MLNSSFLNFGSKYKCNNSLLAKIFQRENPTIYFVYLHSYVHTYVMRNTHTHTYIYTHIRTYIHTYIYSRDP
jgi:hypothetical protein